MMPLKKITVNLFITIATIVTFTASAWASSGETLNIDPFGYFNVYTLGDMGRPGDYYPTDVEGTIGVAGNAYLGLAIGTHQVNDHALHVGGNLNIKAGSMHGRIDVGGDISIQNYYINNVINAGGSVILANSTSGSGTESVNAAGTVIKENPWSSINTANGVTYTPMFDYAVLNQFFLDKSRTISELSALYGSKKPTMPYSTAYFDVQSGINVFEINATEFYATARRAVVRGPADATVYINATDTDAHMGWSLNWDFEGGITQSNVLLNFPDTTNLRVTGGEINVLAPKAETYFPGGAITGNLIVRDLPEGWQVNNASFSDPSPVVPEPSSAILFSSGMAALLGFRKRSKKR